LEKKMVSKLLLQKVDEELENWVPVTLPTDKKFGLFLDYLIECGNVHDAARQADLTTKQIRKFRRANPSAERAFQEALDMGTDAIEAELHRRAVAGVMEPIFYKGRRVNTVRKKSDVLLMFLLKSRRPHLYRDNAPLPDQDPHGDDEFNNEESPAEVIARQLNRLAERQRTSDDPRLSKPKPTKSSGV